MNQFQAKDFIQTKEGLVFAVVEQDLEDGKVLCFLRYQQQGSRWQKLATSEANQLLKEKYPQYLFYSAVKSAYLHAVSTAAISVHYHPKRILQKILAKREPDPIEHDLVLLCQLFIANGVVLDDLGLTGSLLIGAQHAHSDIDLIIYSRKSFNQCRDLVRQLLIDGKLQHLDDPAWQDSYQRRQCDLSYADYVWHEQRKYNKALINNRKFDLGLLVPQLDADAALFRKQGAIKMTTKVIDAQFAYDYPARFLINHENISTVVCYTATYNGQAEQGEYIEVAGQLETSNEGDARILVGSTREARGEYIKVVSGR